MMKASLGALFILVMILACCRHTHHRHHHKNHTRSTTKSPKMPKDSSPYGSWYHVIENSNGEKEYVRINPPKPNEN